MKLTRMGVFLGVLALAACSASDHEDGKAVPDEFKNTAPTGVETQNTFNLSEFTGRQVQEALATAGGDTVVGVVTSTTYFCSSSDPLNVDTGNGSRTYTRDDVDPPGQSTGDTYTTVYENCTEFGRTTNGTSTFTVLEMVGIPEVSDTWTLSTESSNDLTVTTAAGTQVNRNRFAYSRGTDDGITFVETIDGESSNNGNPHTFMTTTTTNSQTGAYTKDVNNSLVNNNRTITTETLQTLAGNRGQAPDEGVVQVTMANASGSTVYTITANGGGNVVVEVDNNGDGVVDFQYTTVWWAAPLFGFI